MSSKIPPTGVNLSPMKWETQKKDRLPCSCCRVSGLIDCEPFLSSSFLLDQIYIKRRTKAMSPHPISTPFLRRLLPSRRQQRGKSKCEGKNVGSDSSVPAVSHSRYVSLPRSVFPLLKKRWLCKEPTFAARRSDACGNPRFRPNRASYRDRMSNCRNQGPAAELLLDHGSHAFLLKIFCYVVLLISIIHECAKASREKRKINEKQQNSQRKLCNLHKKEARLAAKTTAGPRRNRDQRMY